MAEVGRWKPYTQRQGQLLPAFVEDALDPGDPVFFISDAVEQMDLTAVEQRYAALGEHAYDPRLLLKLWLYAATQGVYSGRELGRRVRRDLAFRFLVGDGAVPDFRTINRFRVRHREDFAVVLRETVCGRPCGWRKQRGWCGSGSWRSTGRSCERTRRGRRR